MACGAAKVPPPPGPDQLLPSYNRLTSSQACLLQRLNHPMPQREAALQLGYDPSNNAK